jgi:heptose-I-phosphate ethanolaminephosphotransferase
VVSSLIETFSQSGENGFLLYFSDHGEEVFDAAPHQTLGRSEGAPTRNMYAVPFVLWTSPDWQKAHPREFAALANRKYSNAHFIPTWSDLAGLSYDRFQPELSLVNPAFQSHTRWIGDPDNKDSLRDYDILLPDRVAPAKTLLSARKNAAPAPAGWGG